MQGMVTRTVGNGCDSPNIKWGPGESGGPHPTRPRGWREGVQGRQAPAEGRAGAAGWGSGPPRWGALELKPEPQGHTVPLGGLPRGGKRQALAGTKGKTRRVLVPGELERPGGEQPGARGQARVCFTKGRFLFLWVSFFTSLSRK